MADKRGKDALPTIVQRLRAAHPDARYELDWQDPLQLLVATILAAQCTDERVNAVTPALFAKYPDARAYAGADLAELEEAVRPTGFYRNKARAIRDACRVLVERFGGRVPLTMEEMLELPGVARKTANVVLTNAYGVCSGVVVDTHVARVSRRLGLTDEEKPERIEADLMGLLPREEWIQFGSAVVLHGRSTCTARAPQCSQCLLEDLCPKRGVSAEDVALARPRPAPDRAATAAVRPRGEAPLGADLLPEDWRAVLADEFRKPYFLRLQQFLAEERRTHTVFPPEADVFNAFRLTPYDRTQVLLLGQDPYHDDGQAHGLCFSVRPGIKPPPSLMNIFKELRDDLGCRVPNHGCLESWARQGILLLNAVLTVRAHQPNSHKNQGWETFTNAVIRAVAAKVDPVVFVLWGNYAQKKAKLIGATRHRILTAAHPSPLSAQKFFSRRPFSAIDAALEQLDRPPIDWQLPNL